MPPLRHKWGQVRNFGRGLFFLGNWGVNTPKICRTVLYTVLQRIACFERVGLLGRAGLPSGETRTLPEGDDWADLGGGGIPPAGAPPSAPPFAQSMRSRVENQTSIFGTWRPKSGPPLCIRFVTSGVLKSSIRFIMHEKSGNASLEEHLCTGK